MGRLFPAQGRDAGMEQIIAFGDSNTWGLNPMLKERYLEHIRWTGIVRSRLRGAGFLVAEEGLCGRTTVFEDPYRIGLKGSEDIPGILDRYPEAGAAIVMLGTNDCKKAFRATAGQIGKGLEECLDAFQAVIAPEHILVVSPILLGQNVWRPDMDPEFDRQSVRVSSELKETYAQIARRRGHPFLAASDYAEASRYDEEHMSEEGHRSLADAVCRVLSGVLFPDRFKRVASAADSRAAFGKAHMGIRRICTV